MEIKSKAYFFVIFAIIALLAVSVVLAQPNRFNINNANDPQKGDSNGNDKDKPEVDVPSTVKASESGQRQGKGMPFIGAAIADISGGEPEPFWVALAIIAIAWIICRRK